MPTDRATARAQVAERGLTAAAAERVVRVALASLPVSLVPRATTQLRRFFSPGPWSAEDDATLSAAVGPGRDWFEEELDPELALGFGWRAGSFRVEVRYTPADGSDPSADDPRGGERPRSIGDTFDEPVVVEPGATPADIRFGLGPQVGGPATFTRDDAARDPRIDALFRACPQLAQVTIASGALTATIADAASWPDVLLPLFDAIAAGFVPARAAPPDRQLERATRELGSLRHDSPRDLARILDATTSPDVAFRRVAIERLDGADSTVALRPWKRGLDDSSRAVRRTAARVVADAGRPETRDLLEHALADTDACVRYHAVRGLISVGVAPSVHAVQRLATDHDARVRLAAQDTRP